LQGAGKRAKLPCHAPLQNTVLEGKKKKKASPSYDPHAGYNRRAVSRAPAPRKQEIFSCKTNSRDVMLPEQLWLYLAQHRDYLGKSSVVFPNKAG